MIEQNHNESNTEELITKRSRLKNVISKITKNIDHSFTLNQCVIEKLKHDIKNNKSATVHYMRSCFDEMLDDEDFIIWLSLAVGLKPNRLKKLLLENLPNKRNSLKLPPSSRQDIYMTFKSITSTDSRNNLKRIPKIKFLQNYKEIVDSNLMEKFVQLKKGRTKIMYTAKKMVYVESIRKLCKEFNATHPGARIENQF